MAEFSGRLKKAKKRIIKIKVATKTAMPNSHNARKKLLKELKDMYDSMRYDGNIESLNEFNDRLKLIINELESNPPEVKGQIRIEGLYQELPFVNLHIDNSQQNIPEAPNIHPAEIVEIIDDKSEEKKINRGKFTEEEIDKLKQSLCQFVKVHFQ